MKIKKFIFSMVAFILSFVFLCEPLTAYANTAADVFLRDYKFTKGENKDRFQLETSHFFLMCLETFGVLINPTKWGEGLLLENFYDFMSADLDIVTTGNQDEFIAKHIQVSGDQASDGAYIVNENFSITPDAELSDAIYAFAQAFVDANSPKYRIIDTVDYRQINASKYIDKTQYDAAQLFLKQHENDLILNFSPSSNTSTSRYAYFQVVPEKNILAFAMFTNGTPCAEVVNPDYKFLDIVDCYIYDTTQNAYTIFVSNSGVPYYDYSSTPRLNVGDSFSNLPALFESCSYKNGKSIMVFDSREHAVDWLTGTRDVYTTSGFNNYQSGNSIRITGDTLTNSGNVYTIVNNIVNNYYGDDDEDGGGVGNITDGDIQDIIDKAVNDALNPDPDTGSGGDNSGSGSGSGGTVSGGDSSGGTSGSGFTGFLEGLGKLLDGVLAIVGKLLEYIGKAIELFVDTIAKVLDIVPKAFSEFLAAVFPFFPTEIFTAIELILALSVVLMVIKMFKK